MRHHQYIPESLRLSSIIIRNIDVGILFNSKTISSLLSNILLDIILNKIHRGEYYDFIIESFYIYELDEKLVDINRACRALKNLKTKEFRVVTYNEEILSSLLIDILTKIVLQKIDENERSDYYEAYHVE